MKKLNILFTIAFVFVTLFSTQAFAAGEDMKKGAKSESRSKESAAPAAPMKISNLMDATVKNPQGEQLGEVDDLVVGSDGRIQYMILSHGGFLDIGDRLFAIPWEAVRSGASENTLLVSIDRERLTNAPNFARNEWPNFADPDVIITYYGYYIPKEAGKAKEDAGKDASR